MVVIMIGVIVIVMIMKSDNCNNGINDNELFSR